MDELIAKYRTFLDGLLAAPRLVFNSHLRGTVPDKSGVYRIAESHADWRSSVYVGKTGNLRRRLCDEHLTGNRRSSTLKRKLIHSGTFKDEAAVKQFLMERCVVQYLEVADESERILSEHFAVCNTTARSQ